MRIQPVAYDGAVEAFGRCGMDAELMGASCLRVEGDEGAAVVTFQHFIVGDGRLPVFVIDHLPGTVLMVGREG